MWPSCCLTLDLKLADLQSTDRASNAESVTSHIRAKISTLISLLLLEQKNTVNLNQLGLSYSGILSSFLLLLD